ncbi:MAG: GntR family transcriptional regulator [Acetobacteraceae bacterium]
MELSPRENVLRLRADALRPPQPAVLLEGIAERLREAIIAGTLARGQRQGCRELAATFGVPFGTIRAALRQLGEEGYVHSSGRTFEVAPLRLVAQELLLRRRRVEHALTRSAARLITPFGLRRLERLSQEMVEAQLRQDITVLQRCNYRFHVCLYRHADRPDLLSEMQSLWSRFPFDLMTTMPDRSISVVEEHAAVLRALRSGNPDAAGRAMLEHIEQGWQQFRQHYPLPRVRRHAGLVG